ncbi:MAG: type I 3-dehydroquinate dehydratase [Patescibacteria group bacterium]
MMICVPINKNSTRKLLPVLKKAQKVADIVEIWFDTGNFEEISEKIYVPVIYKVTKPNLKRIKLILRKIPRIHYIDFDIQTKNSLIKAVKNISPKIKIILSYHNFKKTPEIKELQKIVKKMIEKKADIIKIATHAKTYQDSVSMLGFLSQITTKGQTAICLCMGIFGRLTRLTGHLFGNYLMYAPMEKSGKTAPGQVTVKELKQIIKTN